MLPAMGGKQLRETVVNLESADPALGFWAPDPTIAFRLFDRAGDRYDPILRGRCPPLASDQTYEAASSLEHRLAHIGGAGTCDVVAIFGGNHARAQLLPYCRA